MNILFTVFFAISMILLLMRGEGGNIPMIIGGACDKALAFSLSLAGVYCLWMGLMRIAEDCGLLKSLSKAVAPCVRKIFGNISDKARSLVTLSLAANMLGLSNAATPISISAIKQMDEDSPSEKPSYAMTMLFVMNVCGVALVPTTVIGMRAASGSTSPADIFLPNLIVNLLNTVIAAFLTWLVSKNEKLNAFF